MKPEIIIIRYGEIGLKKNITRKFFENKLVKNIKNSLEKQDISFEIKQKRARIYLISKQIEQCSKTLQNIFGITSFSPAYKTNSDKKSLEETSLKIIKNKITKDKSFALKVNRTGNHNFTSQDIAIFLGDSIQKNTKAAVNLSKPDTALFVEIIDKDAFLFFEKKPGIGGLPLGTQGKVLAYIDSREAILAAWFLMRRGCMPNFFVKQKNLFKTVEIFTKNWYCDCKYEKAEIKEEALKKKYDAIVTGSAIKDIETIKNLEKQSNMPVLHPLIGLDDEEINNKMKSIGL